MDIQEIVQPQTRIQGRAVDRPRGRVDVREDFRGGDVVDPIAFVAGRLRSEKASRPNLQLLAPGRGYGLRTKQQPTGGLGVDKGAGGKGKPHKRLLRTATSDATPPSSMIRRPDSRSGRYAS